MKLSGDSASMYQLAASNGAWEFADRISAEQFSALLTALRGEEGNGIAWRTRFIPASVDGRPVRQVVSQKFEFRFR